MTVVRPITPDLIEMWVDDPLGEQELISDIARERSQGMGPTCWWPRDQISNRRYDRRRP